MRGVLFGLTVCLAIGTPIVIAAPGTQTINAARSIHLHYLAGDSDAFYCELNVDRSQPGSYFEVCGFQCGYFGIQEQGDGKHVAIFSVWDPDTADHSENEPRHVKLLFQGDGVRIKRFGGEGVGGQSMMDFDWQIGKTYRFLIRAAATESGTAYSAFIYLNESSTWKHIATFDRPELEKRGKLRGFYSFVEDYRRNGISAGQVRRAEYGNGWVHLLDGKWKALTKAEFTASNSPTEAPESIDAGVVDARFYLQNGGDTQRSLKINATIECPATSATPPADLPAD